MNNVTQYGAIFAAAGVHLDYISNEARLEASIPKTKKQAEIIKEAIAAINKCDNTANYEDGVASIVLADTIDGVTNPLPENVRTRVLTALGIMKEGKYVTQYLSQQKTNRSWHTSTTPNKCVYFGESCTNRGITEVPGKRGRKSTRKPDEYHPMLKSGVIAREQYVPAALEDLINSIPAERLISVTNSDKTNATIVRLHKMDPEELTRIKEEIERRLANA